MVADNGVGELLGVPNRESAEPTSSTTTALDNTRMAAMVSQMRASSSNRRVNADAIQMARMRRQAGDDCPQPPLRVDDAVNRVGTRHGNWQRRLRDSRARSNLATAPLDDEAVYPFEECRWQILASLSQPHSNRHPHRLHRDRLALDR